MTVAVIVALMWIALAVIGIGLVNVARWMVQTSTRHAVAGEPHGDTPPPQRPVAQLEPTSAPR